MNNNGQENNIRSPQDQGNQIDPHIQFDILTLHPEMCQSPLQTGLIGRACKKGSIGIQCHNFREFGLGAYKQVDDTPYGGGSGW